MIVFEGIDYKSAIHCPFCGEMTVPEDGDFMYCDHLALLQFDDDTYGDIDRLVDISVDQYNTLYEHNLTSISLIDYLKNNLDDRYLMIVHEYPMNSHIGLVIYTQNPDYNSKKATMIEQKKMKELMNNISFSNHFIERFFERYVQQKDFEFGDLSKNDYKKYIISEIVDNLKDNDLMIYQQLLSSQNKAVVPFMGNFRIIFQDNTFITITKSD